MGRSISAAFLFILAMTPGMLLAQPATDPLWQKAVEIAERNRDHVPEGAHVNTRITNRGGELIETRHSRVEISLADDGTIVTELVERTENGQALGPTELVEQNRRDTRDRGKWGFRFGESPFLESLQATLEREWIGLGSVDGRSAVEYRFSVRGENGEVTGDAWLDPSTGIPLRIRFSPDDMPMFVKSIVVTIDYLDDPDRWMPTTMTVKGSAGLWLYQRHFRTVYTFDR